MCGAPAPHTGSPATSKDAGQEDRTTRQEDNMTHMTHKTHRTLTSLFALGAAGAAALALATAPALAYRGHVFAHSFDGMTPGPGQLEKFERPAGIAVNEATGNVYVVDVGKNRVEWFNSTGSAFEGSFNGSETPAKTFSGPEGIAVDNSCRLHEKRTGEALSESACEKLDPSNGDVYVLDAGHAVVDKFSAAGKYLNELTGTCEKEGESPAGEPPSKCSGSKFVPFKELDGVAVDASGRLFVAASDLGAEGNAYSFNDHPANKFERGVLLSAEAGALERPGLAVDSGDDLYASFEYPLAGEGFVSELNSRGAVLNAVVDAEALGEPAVGAPSPGIAVEQSSGQVYVDDTTSVARLAANGAPVERLGAGDLTSAGGVAVNASSGQVYAVDSAAGVVAEFTLEPPGPPAVEGESVSNVANDTARLQAEVDPHGASASYHFEYGRCASLQACAGAGWERSAPAIQAPVGSDFEVHGVATTAAKLEPHSAYHYRVVTENEIGGKKQTVTGAEQTFVTQPAGGELVLPDERNWELVSPPNRHGAAILSTGLIQAAAAGGAISYPASAPIEAEPEGIAGGVQVLSTRGPGGWSSRDLAVPHAGATGSSKRGGDEYRLFSQDLSLAALQPFGPFAPLSGEASSEQTAYLRENASGLYTPLVTSANVPAGTVFGGEIGGECAEAGQVACGPKFRGATPDLSHVVLSSPVALTAGAPTGEGLYEWAGGQLQPIGQVREEPRLAFHAISGDGSRVIFSGASEGHEGLLLRDTATGETVQLDVAEAGCGSACSAGGGEYDASSSDSSTVFFTDAHPLTRDSGAGTNGKGVAEADLYVCEVPAAAKLACDLRDLTPLGSGGEHAGVVGVLGSSVDGSYVYFAANGVLTGEADGAGEHAVQGSCRPASAPRRPAQCNLYVLHRGAAGWEAPRLVTVLSGEDRPDWNLVLEKHTARVAPDGEWLAFMSQRSLTGYDNEDASSSKPGERLDEEVYLYRAGAGVECASCDPTGAQPAGVEYSHIEAAHGGLAGGEAVWPSVAWIAASVPGWESYEPGAALYQPRYLSNKGRLFFDSGDALAPQDIDGTQDVYEYEPPANGETTGNDSCTTASASFSERSGGCVDLISAGTSGEESAFLDASESGGDVFLLTSAQLAGQGAETGFGVYDAHECTSAQPCYAEPVSQPPQCATASACNPSQTTQPAISAPASAGFSGPGSPSAGVLAPRQEVLAEKVAVGAKPLTRAQKLAAALKACRKNRSKAMRGKCEASARARYGTKAKKPAGAKHGGKS